MAVNDLFQMAMVYDVSGGDGEFVNVLHFRQTAYDGFSSDFFVGDLLAQNLIALAGLNYLPFLSDRITLDRIDWFVVNNPVVGASKADGTPGTMTAQVLPLRSAPVIKKITGLRGRSYRGRVFLMPEMELNQDQGVLIPGRLITLQAWVDSILSITAGPGNVCESTVYSPTLSNPPTSYLDNVVTSFIVQEVLGSVRGRQKVS